MDEGGGELDEVDESFVDGVNVVGKGNFGGGGAAAGGWGGCVDG